MIAVQITCLDPVLQSLTAILWPIIFSTVRFSDLLVFENVPSNVSRFLPPARMSCVSLPGFFMKLSKPARCCAVVSAVMYVLAVLVESFLVAMHQVAKPL